MRCSNSQKHPEMIRVGGQRAKPCVSSAMLTTDSIYFARSPRRASAQIRTSNTPNIRTHAPGKYHPRNVPERAIRTHAPGKYHPRNVPERANLTSARMLQESTILGTCQNVPSARMLQESTILGTCQKVPISPPPHAGSRAKWAEGWSFTQAQHSCSRTKPFPDPKCGRLARSKMWAPGHHRPGRHSPPGIMTPSRHHSLPGIIAF
jgi:hypothetical protein